MMNVNQGTIDIDIVHLQINMCTNRYRVPGSKKKLLVLGTLLCYMCTYVCNTITQHTTCNSKTEKQQPGSMKYEVKTKKYIFLEIENLKSKIKGQFTTTCFYCIHPHSLLPTPHLSRREHPLFS